jgi:hypothetical protein
MGELIGLGLRGMGKSTINIDLVPSVVEQLRVAEKRKPYLIAVAAVLIGGMAVWAACQHVAATKAVDMARALKDQRDKLSPLKTDIHKLLKQEDSIRKIADGYTNAESDHVFWMDLFGELRGAFASDAVWLTDLEPISGFDPAKVFDPKYDADKSINGQAVVIDFQKVKYGNSSLSEIKTEKFQAVKPKGKNKKAAAASSASEFSTDAVRIRGFWRENPRSQNLVSDLLKRLEEKSETFQFKVQDPANPKKTINLTADQYISKIMTVSSEPAGPDDLAQPFEITLPLARKVAIK